MKKPKKINYKDIQFGNYILAHFIGFAKILDANKIIYISYNTKEICNTEFDPSQDLNQLFLIIERIENLEDKQFIVSFEKTSGLHRCTIFNDITKIIEVIDSAIFEHSKDYKQVDYKYIPKDFNKVVWEACVRFVHYYFEEVLNKNVFE